MTKAKPIASDLYFRNWMRARINHEKERFRSKLTHYKNLDLDMIEQSWENSISTLMQETRAYTLEAGGESNIRFAKEFKIEQEALERLSLMMDIEESKIAIEKIKIVILQALQQLEETKQIANEIIANAQGQFLALHSPDNFANAQ